MIMTNKCITKEDLFTMSAAEFQNLVTNYDSIKLMKTAHTLSYHLIKNYNSIFESKEKIELCMQYYIKRENNETEILYNFLDLACFFLEPEVAEYLLQKGCEVDAKEYDLPIDAPLFRAFHYNVYIVDEVVMDVSEKERLRKIGELLIRNGALLEITIHRYGETITNILEHLKPEQSKEYAEYFQSYQHLFNSIQKKQWGEIRLSMIF